MNTPERYHDTAGSGRMIAAAGLILLLLLTVYTVASRRLAEVEESVKLMVQAKGRSADYTDELRAVRDLKVDSAKDMKNSLTDMAKAKKAVYETGLSLQEEKRLLEKQLEIMTTYLEVDEEEAKIHLLRGDQTLKSFYFPPPLRTMGGDKRAAGLICRIISRERYAYTERGKAETTPAGLKWEPPQVGGTARTSALGEYVLFTDGPLVLHAPVADAALHAGYPHLCAGLTLYSAKRLYESVFIGNKLLIKKSPVSAGTAPAKKSQKN